MMSSVFDQRNVHILNPRAHMRLYLLVLAPVSEHALSEPECLAGASACLQCDAGSYYSGTGERMHSY